MVQDLLVCEYCDQGVHFSCLQPRPDKRPKVGTLAIQYSTVQYSTVQYSTVQYYQYSTNRLVTPVPGARVGVGGVSTGNVMLDVSFVT